MTENSFSFKDAVLDPEKFYERAADVSVDPRWVDSEKRKILLAWKANEEALMRAENEGLDGGERQHLRQVIKELDKFDLA